MKVSIAYATEETQLWQMIDVDDGATVEQVIQSSDLLSFYDIDLKKQRVGIFGKLTKLNSTVQEGDRIEIYNAITRILDDDDDDDEDDE